MFGAGFWFGLWVWPGIRISGRGEFGIQRFRGLMLGLVMVGVRCMLLESCGSMVLLPVGFFFKYSYVHFLYHCGINK